jgi:hypothetical protein
MNTMLWALQILAASVFMYSGINKSIYSEKKLVASGQTGVEGLPLSLIRFIGIIEILGAIGLIVPWWFNVLSILTPISATGFAIIMILAARIHYQRKELKNVFTNIMLFIACVFIAYFRFKF